jgi:hypothetical protein
MDDLGIDGKVTFEYILRTYGGKLWAGYIWLRISTSGLLF